MQKTIVVFLLSMLTAALSATIITGRVVDVKHEPIPFVTISILTNDSLLVAGTITNDDGLFSLSISQPAKLIKVSYVGYKTQVHPLVADNMNFLLIEDATHLDELVVTGRANLVERQIDKIVMNVSSSPFAIGNNGKDILKKAPGVNIDRKGNITVNGKSVEVYIDGRPTYLTGTQLKTMLEGTDGSTIDKLEIITQPSAKYDAAGQGGIINIRTKHNVTQGINGSLSFSYGGMYWRDIKKFMQEDHFSFNLNCRGAKTYTSLALSQQYSDKEETYESLTTTLTSSRYTESCTRNRHQYYTLKLSNDWYIDSINTLGFTLSTPLSVELARNLPEFNRSSQKEKERLLESNTEDMTRRNRWQQHTANINYSHLFSKTLNQELTLNLDYNRNLNRTITNTLNRFFPCSLPEYVEALNQRMNHITNIISARADFETNFWQTGKVECGTKWMTTSTAFRSATDTLSAGILQSELDYTEHIGALYLTAGKQFGEHWTTKLGLRGEYTYSSGRWLTIDSTSSKSYFNLFPTAFVAYLPTEEWSMSMDYARRIQRPHYTMLDPSPQYEDAHSLRKGNVELKPAFTHNLLISFGYSEYVTLDFDFSHTTDWTDYKMQVLDNGMRISEAVNYGTVTTHGIHLSLTEIPVIPKLSWRNSQGHRELLGGWLTLTSQMGVDRRLMRSYDGIINHKIWTFEIYAELNAYLPKDWTVSLDGFYSTPSVWGSERCSDWKELNFALKKDIPKYGLTLTARVNDLMLSSQWGSETMGLPEGYSNTFLGYDRAHMLTLSLSWKFGSMLEHRDRQESITTDRLETPSKRKH